jgi:hypothetical protein
VLQKNVPYGKIIKAPFSTQPLEMLPGFPAPIPGIVVLTAGPIFPDIFDYDSLKIVYDNPLVIPHECFQRAGFVEIKVGSVFCPVFGWWQWHIFIVLAAWILMLRQRA